MKSNHHSVCVYVCVNVWTAIVKLTSSTSSFSLYFPTNVTPLCDSWTVQGLYCCSVSLEYNESSVVLLNAKWWPFFVLHVCLLCLRSAIWYFCICVVLHFMFMMLMVCAAYLFCHADTLLRHCCQVWAFCALTSVVSNLCLIPLCVPVCVCVCVYLLGVCAARPGRERGEFGTPAWLHSRLATSQLQACSVSFLPPVYLSQHMLTSCGRRTNQNALTGTQYVTHNWSFLKLT